jgi:hypothetical protein
VEGNVEAQATIRELDNAGAMQDGFDVTAFASFVDHHSALLVPAFVYQQRLRERVGGDAFWRSCSAKRLQLSSGKYVPIEDLMAASLSPRLQEALSRIDSAEEPPLSQSVKFLKSLGGLFSTRRVKRQKRSSSGRALRGMDSPVPCSPATMEGIEQTEQVLQV